MTPTKAKALLAQAEKSLAKTDEKLRALQAARDEEFKIVEALRKLAAPTQVALPYAAGEPAAPPPPPPPASVAAPPAAPPKRRERCAKPDCAEPWFCDHAAENLGRGSLLDQAKAGRKVLLEDAT